MGANILKQILIDLYERLMFKYADFPIILDIIEKLVNCGDPNYGYALYSCDKCGYKMIVPFRCHSRFCFSCGNKYKVARSIAMQRVMMKADHRHCVFTIDESLRPYFEKDHSLINLLFKAVSQVILECCRKDNKKENFTPGFICIFHSFGRDLKFNPHVHVLLSSGGMTDSGNWKTKDYYSYPYLRKAFMKVLLDLMTKKLGPQFKPVKNQIYKNDKNGFYVYAPPLTEEQKKSPEKAVEYVTRYCGRPPLAAKAIDRYDDKNKMVTWHYKRHEDDKVIEETIPAMEFLERLFKHVPDPNFKQIRYYGLYARHRAKDQRRKIRRQLNKEHADFFMSCLKWRTFIGSSFHYDPCECPKCGNTMTFEEIIIKHQRVPLEEMYEKTMRKYRARNRPPPVFDFKVPPLKNRQLKPCLFAD